MSEPAPDEPPPDPEDICEVCGSVDVVWMQCTLLCRNCGSIVKSCADLNVGVNGKDVRGQNGFVAQMSG